MVATPRPVRSATVPRSGSSGRCGQVRQLVDDQAHGRAEVHTWHRADAGGCAHALVPWVACGLPLGRLPGHRDRGRPDDAGAVVHHHGLARSDPLGRVEQVDGHGVLVGGHDRPVLLAVGTQLHGALQRHPGRGSGAAPAWPDRLEALDGQRRARTDGHRAGDRLDVEHVAGASVRSGRADAEALALADRVAPAALVLAEHVAAGVDDGSTTVDVAQLLGEPAAGVAVADEADVVAVRLVGDGQTTPVGLLADDPLRGVAQREHRVRELVLGEHAEDVGLVLRHVLGPVHLDQPVGAGAQLRVVTGDHCVEAERDRPVEHGRELDLLVAAQAGVGRAALGVLLQEVLDDVLVEAVAHVPDVERDPDDVGCTPGVVGVLDRAAAASTRAVGLRVAREGQVDAGDVVPLLGGACCGHCRVHAARHRCQDPHQLVAPGLAALRARSTTGPIASMRASTSACVEVCPRENRSEARANSSEEPIAIRTCEACGTPASQADPVEHSMPRASSSISSESPSQPGNARCALAGRRSRAGLRVAVVDRVRHLASYAGDQCVAQLGEPLGELGLARHRRLAGHREPRDRGRVDRARADVALLATAVQQRGRLQLPAYDERADAVGAADLVPGHGHRVDARAGEVEGQLAEGLDGVGVHRDAVGVGDLDDLGDRLHRADLVVGPHHRHQGDALGVGLDGRPEGVDVEPAEPVDVDQLDLGALTGQPDQRVEHGVVLDRRAQDAHAARVLGPARPEQALDGEVVGLGAAGGEHHLARPAAQRPGDRLARLLDDPPGVAAPIRAARTRCRPGRAARSSPRQLRGGSAWSPRGRDRRSSPAKRTPWRCRRREER